MIKMAAALVEPTILEKKISEFNSELSEYFKYKSNLVEDSEDEDSGQEGGSDDPGEGNEDGASRAKSGFSSQSGRQPTQKRGVSAAKSISAGHAPLDDAIIGSIKDETLSRSRRNFEREQNELEEFKETFSRKCEQVLRVDTGIARGFGKAVAEDKGPKLAELFHYEGFDSKRTNPLPDIQMSALLQITLQAQYNLSHKKAYESEARHFLLSDLSVDIATDVFWWFFLDKYEPNDVIQSKIMERMSDNYVRFLWKPPTTPKTMRYRNDFFKNYPEILSQAIYCAFCHTFPSSWRQYNEKFIDRITSTVFLWLTGCKAELNQHRKWQLTALEPPTMKADFESEPKENSSKKGSTSLRFPDDVGFSENSSPDSIRKHGRQLKPGMNSSPSRKDNTSSKSKSTKGSLKTRTNTELSSPVRRVQFSSPTGTKHSYAYKPNSSQRKDLAKSTPLNAKGHFDHILFNVKGVSPLLANYLSRNVKTTKLPWNRILINRTETARVKGGASEETDEDAVPTPTYAQFVARQFKETRAVLQDVAEKDDKFNREIMELWRSTNSELRESEEKLKILLTYNEQVKKLSNLLMLEIMTEPSARTAVASNAIKEALDSIDKNKNALASNSKTSLLNGTSHNSDTVDIVANQNALPLRVTIVPPIS